MVELKEQDYKYNKEKYLEMEETLHRELGGDVPIDHVGSTALPNMVGKNIIDILVGARDSEEFSRFREVIKGMGYYASPRSVTEIYQFFASREGETGEGDIHIHLVIMGTKRYKDFIVLRDYLLNNNAEATSYANYKRELLNSGVTDRKEYRRIKGDYVTSLIERANRANK